MLKEKKRKITLNLNPTEPENISDDEYPVVNEQAGGMVEEDQIQTKLDLMTSKYYQQATGKEPPSLPTPKRWKKIPWIQHQSIAHGTLDLSHDDVENDFKRELAFYNIALENSRKAIEKLNSREVPVWRPADYKVEMLKNDRQMDKVQGNLSKIKQKIELVEKRKQAKNRKTFSEVAHKKHVQAKQSIKSKYKKKERKNRPDQKKNKPRHRKK